MICVLISIFVCDGHLQTFVSVGSFGGSDSVIGSSAVVGEPSAVSSASWLACLTKFVSVSHFGENKFLELMPFYFVF